MAMILAADDARVRAVSAYYPTLRHAHAANRGRTHQSRAEDCLPGRGTLSGTRHPDHQGDLLEASRRAGVEERARDDVKLLYPDATHSFFPQLHEAGSADASRVRLRGRQPSLSSALH